MDAISIGMDPESIFAPPPKATLLTSALVLKANPSRRIESITLVGAGGIGARMVPLLVKMLPEGATINVVDPDLVKPRNLWRQHFTEDDLGQPKAEVMAARYNGINGVEVAAYVEPYTPDRDYYHCSVLIGAVDNRAARQSLLRMSLFGVAYIDAGNLTDRGQVLLHCLLGGLVADDLITKKHYNYVQLSAAECMPEIFDAAQEQPEEEGCNRPDLQTVAINSMAATVAANAAYLLINQVPFWAAGWFFTPMSCEPIKIASTVDRAGAMLTCKGIWHGR